MANTEKYVYSFGGGVGRGPRRDERAVGRQRGEPRRDERDRHSGSTRFHAHDRGLRGLLRARPKLPEEVKPQVEAALSRMEEAVGKKFGDPADPLLVSVRSGAALSMPGMMNTILNLGLTDASVEGLAKKTGNPRFAYDGYRRLIDMFGSTAMGVEHEAFEHELAESQERAGRQARHRAECRRPQGTGPPLQGGVREARQGAISPGSEGAALEGDHGGLQ